MKLDIMKAAGIAEAQRQVRLALAGERYDLDGNGAVAEAVWTSAELDHFDDDTCAIVDRIAVEAIDLARGWKPAHTNSGKRGYYSILPTLPAPPDSEWPLFSNHQQPQENPMKHEHPIALETITKLQRAIILSVTIHTKQLVLSQWIDERHDERAVANLESEINELITEMQTITEDWA